jgi:tetratricopeptide (TPR) repeat protein
MRQVTAFVARSFEAREGQRIQPILEFLSTFRKAGFFWDSAEPAEVQSVSRKVQGLIAEKDVFIGFFTRRHPVYSFTSRVRDALGVLLRRFEPQIWSSPPWVLQESGYAIAAGKDLILLREDGVEIPGLQGDLEYITFDPQNPTGVFPKLSEMVNDLLARAAGRTVELTISERPEEGQVGAGRAPLEAKAAASGTGEQEWDEHDILVQYWRMGAAARDRDFEGLEAAWTAGSKLIAQQLGKDIDELTWRTLYLGARFEAGDVESLEVLRQLLREHPKHPAPASALARCLSSAQEHEDSARLFLEAAKLQQGDARARSLLGAANGCRELKRYDEATSAAREAVSAATGELRAEALSSLYQILQDCGKVHFAFATAESALHENPLLPIRFKLGLDYHRRDFNELALFHFKFLHERDRTDASSLHNFSLLQSDCELLISAVENYKKCFAMGQTLSAANLGFMYLDAGMAEEAKQLIDQAMRIEPHEVTVEKCLAEIKQRSKDERENEDKLLEIARAAKKFFLDVGVGLGLTIPRVDGRWEFPFGEMTLTSVPAGISGTAEIKREELPLVPLLGMAGPAKEVRTEKYSLEGRLTGAVCEFELTVTDISQSWGPLGSILGGPNRRSGFIIFGQDGRSATYAELAGQKIGERKQIVRVG